MPEPVTVPEPVTALQRYHCTKHLLAGEIIAVTLGGCYVQNANGTTVLRRWEDAANAHGAVPSDFSGVMAGDFWCVDGGRQYVIKRAEFCADWLAHVAPAVGPGTTVGQLVTRIQDERRRGGRRNRLSLTAMLLIDDLDDRRRHIDLPPLPRDE